MRPNDLPRADEDAQTEETEAKQFDPSTRGEPPCMLSFIDAMDEVRSEYLPWSDEDVQLREAEDDGRDNPLINGSANPYRTNAKERAPRKPSPSAYPRSRS